MAREIKEETDHKNLTKRGAVWYVKRMVNGERIVQSTGKTKLSEARDVRDLALHSATLKTEKQRTEGLLAKVGSLDRQLAEIEDGKPSVSIVHGWQAYLDQHKRPDTGPETLAMYQGQFEAFAKWIKGAYPKVKELRHVTQKHVDQYAGILLKRVSASTFNRHIVLLALVWRVLEKAARLTGNPWKEIGRKCFFVRSRRELTIAELGAVFNAAQGEMRLLLGLGTFCGLRLGDAACLEWGNVDMVKGLISLIPHKTARRAKKRIMIPIHRTLFDMLSQIHERKRHGLILPTTAARFHSFGGALARDVANLFLSVNIKTNVNKLTASEKDVLKAAKDEAQKNGSELLQPASKIKRAKADRASADCGFHSLRHTFVSLCAAGGVPLSVVQSLVGHSSPAMTQHYTHIDVATAQNAVAMLPDVTKTDAGEGDTNMAGAALAAVMKQLNTLTTEQLKETKIKIGRIIAARMKNVGTVKASGSSAVGL